MKPKPLDDEFNPYPPEDAPADVFAALLPELAPIEPTDHQRAALRDRVLARARAEAAAPASEDAAFVTIRAAQGRWHEIAAGVTLKLLYRDADRQSFLLRIAPGSQVPAHDHPSVEECLVLEGDAYAGDVHLFAGDYHLARPGSLHRDLSSPNGALLLIHTGAEGPRVAA